MLWTLELDGPLMGRVVATVAETPIVFAATDRSVTCVRLRDGAALWRREIALHRADRRRYPRGWDVSGGLQALSLDGRAGDDLVVPVSTGAAEDEATLRALAGADGAPLWIGPAFSLRYELELRHGELSCASCHDEDRRYLHLADGERLEFDETMRLCAQCHGVQHRDYQRGSHGGMSGHWDLRQGPRLRNHCVDCHAAHDPSIKPVTAAPRTSDRGGDDQKEHH